MKKIFNNKRNIIIIIVTLLIIIIGTISIIILNKDNQKKILTERLENIARNFYENEYYPRIEKNTKDIATYLKDFSKEGIEVDLKSLTNTLDNKEEVLKEFVNKKTNQVCNNTTSKVTIKPQEPYGKTNYTIIIFLDCGF